MGAPGCGGTRPAAPAAKCPEAAPCKCASIEELTRALGDEGRTIDVVLYGSTQPCRVGDARHYSVTVDDGAPRPVSLPCYRDSKQVVIIAPPPGYDGGDYVVSEGTHTVIVKDEDTGLQDHETFSVPHVEVDGMVGNHVDAWVGEDGVSVRGPTALRAPRL